MSVRGAPSVDDTRITLWFYACANAEAKLGNTA